MNREKYKRKLSSSSQQQQKEEQLIKKVNGIVCSYCLLDDQRCLAKCIFNSCGKYFCNMKGQQPASHIVMHLIRAKHYEIQTCEKNQLGKITIECYICRNKNVFILGSVQLEDENSIILCRNPCMCLQKNGSLKWNGESWAPLIKEKQFSDFLFQREGKNRREISTKQIYSLEQAWRNNPKLNYQQIDKKGKQKKLKHMKQTYSNGQEYQDIIEPLIEQQQLNDKKRRQNQSQQGVTIKFIQAPKRKKLAYFQFRSREDFAILPGNQLLLKYKSQTYDWQAKGVVIKVSYNDQVCIQLQYGSKSPPSIQTGYSIDFVWKSTSFSRMKKGVHIFINDQKSISSYLFYSIIGKNRNYNPLEVDIPKDYHVKGLPILNQFQIQAVRKALIQPLCLIQGPPGTGKTVISAAIVYHLVNNRKRKTKILVCAPSNIVVDMLASRIYKTGINVVRFYSKTRESVSTQIQFLGLHQQIRNLKNQKFKQLLKFLDSQQKLTQQQQQKLRKLKKDAQMAILQQADVICSTCIASADHRLKSIRFQHVLIDEATQAVQPQSLLPMIKGAKHVILVGDHRQLGPVVISRKASKSGLSSSLFERLVKLNYKPLRLQVQYRMHPSLSKFPSDHFYQGSLQNGIGIQDRPIQKNFKWPTQQPLFFINSKGTQQISASGTSYLNRSQAQVVQHILSGLLQSSIKTNQIGIITPYKGQISFLQALINRSSTLLPYKQTIKQIQISSVDGFQGRQKDYIIISCVRSNDSSGIGFLTQPRRMNVSITRAKYGLILIGNVKVLARDQLWNSYLYNLKLNNLVFEGSYPNWKICSQVFKPPQEKKKDENFDAEEYANFDYLDEIDN